VSWLPHYGWIADFWKSMVADRPGRTWLVAGLFDGDLHLRDGVALANIRQRLAEEGHAVRYLYVPAFEDREGGGAEPNEDVLFVGRPKSYFRSPLSPLARALENKGSARFIDRQNGTSCKTVYFGTRVFAGHELEAPPEHYRRRDVDYGVLLCRRHWQGGTERRLVAISGLSMLGTLGLTLVLTNDDRRKTLTEQVQKLADEDPTTRPDELVEICVRIAVAGEERLADILNSEEFTFRAEAVAVARGEPGPGTTPMRFWTREAADAEVTLIPHTKGGVMRVEGSGEIELSPARFALLRELVRNPPGVSTTDLCRTLSSGTGGLAKLVHDLNRRLSRVLPGPRVVRFQQKVQGYSLGAVRGTILEPPARR
jgi:hypothetical protein